MCPIRSRLGLGDVDAAIEARERLLAVAAGMLEIAPEDLDVVDGTVQPRGVPAKALPIGVAGAVANAIAAATGGGRLRKLPMTPESVWRALVRDEADEQPH